MGPFEMLGQAFDTVGNALGAVNKAVTAVDITMDIAVVGAEEGRRQAQVWAEEQRIKDDHNLEVLASELK